MKHSLIGLQSGFSFTSKLKSSIMEAQQNIGLPSRCRIDAGNISAKRHPRAWTHLLRRYVMDNLSSNTPQDNPLMRKKRTNVHITLNCTYCKKYYSVRESRALRSKTHYCSKDCYKADNLKGEMRQCLFCGKDVYVKKGRLVRKNYCSPSCYSNHHRNRKTCLQCKKTFEVVNNLSRKFCSQECSQSYRVGPNAYNYKGNIVECICLFCGSSFQNPEAWVKRNRGKFCSTTCRSRHTIEKQGGMVSSIEIAVKEVLEGLGETYHHQHRIGRFLVDFYLPGRNLVIEADGDYWHSLEKNKKNDIKKDQYMKEAQINLARLKESEIRSSCSDLVRATLAQFPLVKGE